ncbi:MAG TPA: hypothetical protein PK440_16430 [Candidatus Accumulibacter phosphatis]|nr:MAG: hypothetical protein AW07_03545 [Candidatus Accumulibacter sp. SK-11]HAY27534.1 hypothetical protein [Accumulibacter sp.]HCN69711.1 hypothetical protein [Accumulibacter sp.]HRL76895.1 hypothetical protein [Candidatus Accumulibacter phosphatis]HRQ96565.1 hypothetical protein [Candidatus Accumulibacter phosphatis]
MQRTPAAIFVLSAFALVLAGCASQQQMLASEQDQALLTAVRRGQFEMSCPTARGVVLSANMLQPVLWNGIERAEYTIGVEGCGQKATYVSVCPLGSPGCVAVSGRNLAQ